MVAYSDDDEIDYENETPDFHDEQDLDDYLNDEEYDLMNDLLPLVRNGMEDFDGWNNFDLKLALFDSDFNTEEALSLLMKDFKKKKTNSSESDAIKLTSLASIAKQKAQLNKIQSNREKPETMEDRPMTLLEKLKSKRNQNTAGAKISNDVSQSNPAMTLAEKLSKFKTRNAETPKKSNTLVSKSNAIEPKVTSNRTTSSKEAPADPLMKSTEVMSLAEKLKALKQNKLDAKKESKPVNKNIKSGNSEELKTESIDPNNVSQVPSSDNVWNFIQTFNKELKITPYLKGLTSDLAISNFIIGNSGNFDDNTDKSHDNRQKRQNENIFAPFFPNKRIITNNLNKKYTVKQKVIENFNKPSPDDIILTAQKNAFNQVQENVSKLKISEDKKPDEIELDGDDSDEFGSKKEELISKSYKKAAVATKPKTPIDIEKYIETVKPHCTFVVLGHVDAGKSTLMGRLLYDIGAVDSNLIRKLKRESESIGKGSFHLAWVMDQTNEERARGVTVSICTSDFETDKSRFTIVDAPGHRDFVPSAISGISQADVAIITIDCGTDAFESGFNLDGQTKEHSLLAKSLGVKRLIVAMNKLDSVDWFEGRFNQIQSELKIFFDDIGFKEEQLDWVPVSGLTGEGVHKIAYPTAQNWYKGPTLVGLLEEASEKVCEVSYNEVIEEPFLFSILEVSESNKHETGVISGRVESGTIQPGETITIYPSEQSVIVDKITVGDGKAIQKIAIKNDFVSIRIRNAFIEDIQPGDLCASVGFDIPPTQDFNVNLLTFKLDRPVLPGTSFMMFRGVCEQPARIGKLISSVDKKDPTKILKKKIRHLATNQGAIVEILLTEKKRWIPLLSYNDNKHLGRIVLRKDGRTIGAGIVMP
ncbi:hypothetical protein TPHA_0J01470 [Tetrapisispora phaffii CBS 4417]|uniref:Elongation factor 1 alpha-like protein n=1 Tax=Tetrapisispora phaffii (strain ATCC 24235 / CBS 4417 / NBRC 1672 / NRRL Y-8282 / UCD 70-5) TaxID=1071381 RepID=G8BYM7_TETPH|nr:hypothetical protein TPHA_0J01470 [Tetrapisispora phaffii CBS 4417]CCE64969.1 hypothetical protein TPHA_0J01470 [Tetrapisispora phaffii CBS 4417]